MSVLASAFCKRHHVVVMDHTPQAVTVGYCGGSPSPALIAEITRVFTVPVQWEAIPMETWQEHASDWGASVEEDDTETMAHLAEGMPAVTDLLSTNDEAPIIQLLHAMLAKAITQGASDVHVDMFQESVSCRMRIDGQLRDILSPPLSVATRLLSRIKVMADLDIAQKRLPQDGRMTLQLADHTVDVRVATLPTQYGERAVLRLLDKKETPMTIDELELPLDQMHRLKALLKQPHGLVLLTGPTGSGKTTTLYAALRGIDYDSINVMTVEDPVEYTLTGIAQTPVNPAIGLTFSQGLRAILRQDPDVIMVGEIRDTDTASMAVQASLTGHLVLSTLHTNTAVDAIVRCRELGVPPYLLATSLSAVLSQRLLRRLCRSCVRRREATPSERRYLTCTTDEPVYLGEPTGCDQCHRTGYRGRFAVMELLVMDGSWAEAIHQELPAQALHALAAEQGKPLLDAARDAVLSGITSIQEWLRLVPSEQVIHEDF